MRYGKASSGSIWIRWKFARITVFTDNVYLEISVTIGKKFYRVFTFGPLRTRSYHPSCNAAHASEYYAKKRKALGYEKAVL